jgi:Tol biopolymer transport system component
LLFIRQGTLFAQDFDPVRLELKSNPIALATDVAFAGVGGGAAVSASDTGMIVYRTGAGAGQRQFVWFDRSGKEVEKLGSVDTDAPLNPALSPDGRRKVFQSDRKGALDLYQKSTTGEGAEELLVANPTNKNPFDWSPDGRFLLYRDNSLQTGGDIWAVQMDGGDRKPFLVVQTKFTEQNAQFSPDGKWIAYESDESGRFEVYIQRFPGPGGKLQVSNEGAAQPRWRRDGKELFYVALDGRLTAVPLDYDPNGQIEARTSVPLFATNIGGAAQGVNRQQYIVSPDGQRFLMNTFIEGPTPPATLLLNWKPRP